jgi:hypothetical protein
VPGEEMEPKRVKTHVPGTTAERRSRRPELFSLTLPGSTAVRNQSDTMVTGLSAGGRDGGGPRNATSVLISGGAVGHATT